MLNKCNMSGPGPQYSEPGYAGHLTKELDVEAQLKL